MKKAHKILCWFVGVPIMSTLHFFATLRLFILLFMWGEGLKPPLPWMPALVGILFFLMNPFMLLFSFIDAHISRFPDFWYMPVSFIVSAIAWWTLIVWFITTHPRGKGAA